MPQKILSFWRRWEWPSFGRSAGTPPALAELSEDEMLAAVLAEPPGFERRAAIRHNIDRPTSCRAIALVCEKPWPAVVRDISTTGIGLILQEPVEIESFLAVELPRNFGAPPLRIQARVVINRPQPDGTWLVGCRLARPLSSEEVESLL